MIDIDDFKEVNDRLGHQVGDEVLRKLGEIILQRTRKADFPARYGGEEMVVILPATSIDKAIIMADTLREHISDYFAESGTPVTVSIGVSSINAPRVTTSAELVRQADKALYVAKRTGKNKVEQYA